MRLLIIAVLCIAILGCAVKGFEPTDEDNLKRGIREDFTNEPSSVLNEDRRDEWQIMNVAPTEKPRGYRAKLTNVTTFDSMENVIFIISSGGVINDVFFGRAFFRPAPIRTGAVAQPPEQPTQPQEQPTAEDMRVMKRQLEETERQLDETARKLDTEQSEHGRLKITHNAHLRFLIHHLILTTAERDGGNDHLRAAKSLQFLTSDKETETSDNQGARILEMRFYYDRSPILLRFRKVGEGWELQ